MTHGLTASPRSGATSTPIRFGLGSGAFSLSRKDPNRCDGQSPLLEASALAANGIKLTADGGSGDDILIGGEGNDVLLGGNGDDDGDGVLIGGPGVDVLNGGSGDNIIIQD